MLLPQIRYRDPAAAIEWLCEALGFEEHFIASGENDSISYAQLTFGDSAILVSPVRDTVFDKLTKQPDEIGGAETQSCYFVVNDVEAHYGKAKAAGAEIVLEIDKHEHGRGYSCRDPEGHLWTFGTFEARPRQFATDDEPRPIPGLAKEPLKRAALALGLVTVLVGSAASVWIFGPARPPVSRTEPSSLELARSPDTLAALPAPVASDRSAEEAAKRAIEEAQEQLAHERIAREGAERTALEAHEQLARERSARDMAERSALEAKTQLAQEQSARERAERAASESAERAAQKIDAPPDAQPLAGDAAAKDAEEPASGGPSETPITGHGAEKPAQSDAEGASLLAQGQGLMAKGDVAAAREIFERAADAGLAEAALALGSTYDPVSLSRLGLTRPAPDPQYALKWYRRAHELAAAAGERQTQAARE